jgi:hypothetical protein
MALSSIDKSKDSSTANPLSSLDKVDPTQKKIMDAQDELINSISSRGGGTPWFKMAAGFLKPTRSGGFGESLGNVAENISNYQDEQQKQEIPLAQAKIGLLQNKLTAQKEANVRSLLPSLYTTTKNSLGVDKYVFNPEVAQQLGAITGDQKYLSMIPEENRKNQLQTARDNLFNNPDGTTGFNRQAAMQLYSLDSKEALDTFKKIPDLRRAGILPATGAEGTPFDALALSLEGSFKDQAIQLANRYKAGLIKDEDADKMANQLLTASTSHLDRQASQAQSQATHALANVIAQDSLNFRKTTEQNKEDEKKSELRKKNEQLRDMQVQSADNTIKAVNELRNHPGRFSGITGAFDVRKHIPGTDEYDFVNALETAKSNVFSSTAQGMRGLGPFSDTEGKKLTALYGSLNPGMSKAAFDKTLDQITNIMNEHKVRAEKLMVEPTKTSQPDINSEAVKWAKEHPNDPKSKVFLDFNGVK